MVTQNPVDTATAVDLLRQNQPPDVIGRQPRLRVVGVNGWNPNLTLPPAVTKQISVTLATLKTGDVRSFQAGPLSITMRVNKSSVAALPPLAQIWEQVERQARLEKAPAANEMIARLYQAAKPTFNYDPEKYASYFSEIQNYSLGKDSGKKTASVP